MRFMEEMLKIFPSAEIRCLCGDREFIGQACLRYLLLKPSLAFCLRVRSTDKIEHNGKILAANIVFAHLAIGESQRLHPIPIKKHGRRAISFFRLGFDHLRHLILNHSLPNHRDFLHSLQFLSCT